MSLLEPALQGLGAPPGVGWKWHGQISSTQTNLREVVPKLIRESSSIPKTFTKHSDTILGEIDIFTPDTLFGTTVPLLWLIVSVRRSFPSKYLQLTPKTMRTGCVRHKTLREVAPAIPVSQQRSQGLENRQNRFSALFRRRRLPDPAQAGVSGFLRP